MNSNGQLSADERDDLKAFARRIERQIIKSGGDEAMERLICRILTNKKQLQVAGAMAGKWVEWRYGKSVEVKHSGTVIHEHVDLTNVSDEQLSEADRLIDSALEALGRKE